MARKLKSDKVLFLSTLLLLCVSVVMVYNTSTSLADGQKTSALKFLLKQATWVVLGMLLMAGAMRFDYRKLKDPRILWTLLVVAGLALVVVLFMPAVKGGRRWIFLGPLGTLQPSELAKLVVVIFTAAILEQRMVRINDVRYSLAPIGIVLAVALALIYFEHDAGSMMVLVAIVGTMVFAAGLSWRYLLTAVAGLVPAAAALIWMEQYRQDRLTAFLDPWKDPLRTGFQLIQSEIAVSTGGAFGKGLGGSVQSLFYLPEAHNDFIYAIIGEELGLVGTSVILACFVVITWRGLRVAARAQDAFASLLAIGISTMIGVQALVNMSMVIGLMPTKGIALPFVSAGGSSLVVSMVAIGILLNISQGGVADA